MSEEPSTYYAEAKRDPVPYRYDLIPPECLAEIAKVFGQGAIKYGDYNYQNERLVGHKSPINHSMAHIMKYQMSTDAGARVEELSHAAVNLIIELFYELNREKYDT